LQRARHGGQPALRRAHHHDGRWIARAHGAELVHRRGIVAVDEVQVRRPGRFGIALQEARRAPRGEAEDAGEQQPLRLAEADYVDEVVFVGQNPLQRRCELLIVIHHQDGFEGVGMNLAPLIFRLRLNSHAENAG